MFSAMTSPMPGSVINNCILAVLIFIRPLSDGTNDTLRLAGRLRLAGVCVDDADDCDAACCL